MQIVNDVMLLPNPHYVRCGLPMLEEEVWVIWHVPNNCHQSSATDQEKGNKTKQKQNKSRH